MIAMMRGALPTAHFFGFVKDQPEFQKPQRLMVQPAEVGTDLDEV